MTPITAARPRTQGELILQAGGVTMRFGGLTAVDNVSMKVHEGEIVGLIGPNGAGKTTFFNCLTGMYVPTEGRVTLNGDTLPPKPLAVVRAGMARTFQNIRLFANMTALENVMVGRYCRTSSMALTSILRGPKFRREEAATRERAQELLDYVGLAKSAELLARNMPYGDQRRLEIARALATDPQILLLDEPTAGMNPKETEETMHLIFKIRDSGLAVVVIEHDMRFIFNLCDRVLCLVRGAAARRGHARRGAVRPPGHRGLHRWRRRGGERVSAMLEVRDLEVSYGKIKAVKGISLRGQRGRGRHPDRHQRGRQDDHPAHHLGPVASVSGSITFQGRDLTTVQAHDIVQLGLAHSPEGRRIFPRLSVEENLRLGAFARKDKGINADLDAAFALFPILEERRAQPAGTFSGGEQQMLAMGRAMMSRPKLLMLDEPSMGLSPLMMKRIMTTVTTLQQQGTTILLVEQNAQAALKRATKGYVLEVGNIVLSGTGQELLASDDVRKAYLGED